MPDYLKNLTSEQHTAATEIEGPMMVIAGPGTGKTQVLSSRIAHIRKTTDTSPDSILVLTFTESGAIAVRKRLASMIGSDAYYVSIYTFHGFAESIISTYKHYFPTLGAEVLTQIDQITMIRKLLDEMELTRLKIIDDSYYYTRDIIRTISNLKREAISSDELSKITNDEIETIKKDDNSFNKKTGKMKTVQEARINSLEKTLELAEVYKEYERELREQKKHDYDDMIIEVLNKIKTDINLKADLQERYLYFLVDEYQDTNGAQNQVVTQLADNPYFENPNIFVVGDDDQSIYKFQGASLSNILYFKTNYPSSKVVIMTQSHRSTQKVLDASMSVIQNNTQRLVNVMNLNKVLTSNIQDPTSKVELAEFDHERYEYIWIVNKIKELIAQGLTYSDIAIFFRNNGEIATFSTLLQSHNIPVTSEHSSNIMDDTFIRNLITLIRVIADPEDDRLFFSLLCQPWSEVTTLDRIKLTTLRSKKRISFFDLVKNYNLLKEHEIGFEKESYKTKYENEPTAAQEIVQNEFSLFADSLDVREEPNSLIRLSSFLIDQNQRLHSENFAVFFNQLLETINFRDRILVEEDRLNILNKLSTLFDEIKRRVAANSHYTYEDFLNYIDIIEEYGLPIVEKTLDLNTDSVRLMTAHKSKGLEFRIVFVPRLVDRYWGNSMARENIAMPEGVVKYEKPSKDEKNEEERRLFYVALTRAKSQLYLSYSNQYESAYGIKNTMPSMFIGEIEKELLEEIKPQIVISEDDILKEVWTKGDEKKVASFHSQEEENYIRTLLDNFKLNATALNNYLECPRKFFYMNLLKIPSLKKDRQSFGTAMHKALEVFFDKAKEDGKLPDKELLYTVFEETLAKEIIADDIKAQLLESGRQGLEGYYNQVIIPSSQTEKVLFTELNFDKRNVNLDDIPLTGKIDAVIVDNNEEAKVIDYKTGRIYSHNEIEKYSLNSEGVLVPSGYYAQLMFYKLLTENDKTFKYNVNAGVLDFIEGRNGKYKREAFEYKTESIDAFKILIKETVNRIKQLDFEKIPKSKTCKKCPFYMVCWGG